MKKTLRALLILVAAGVVWFAYEEGYLDRLLALVLPKKFTVDDVVAHFRERGLAVSEKDSIDFGFYGALDGGEVLIGDARVIILNFKDGATAELKAKDYQSGAAPVNIMSSPFAEEWKAKLSKYGFRWKEPPPRHEPAANKNIMIIVISHDKPRIDLIKAAFAEM